MTAQLTRLVLIRHARHDPRGRNLQHACEGLTPIGVAQAEALATRLARTFERDSVAGVLSSRARRAIQTAEAIAAALGSTLSEPTCDLCEVHPGEAEGLTQEEMRQRFGPSYAYVPGAEHYPDWLPRATQALNRIASAYAGRTVICSTHAGVLRASFVAFGKMADAEAAMTTAANTSITEWSCLVSGVLEKDPYRDRGVWKLDRYNDIAHLE
jgi:broad specificity phosphatase PhoE